MSETYQLSFRDYISMARRRAWVIAATFSVVLGVGLAITMLMPPVYQSTGTIVIESQQVPTDLVQATVTSFADERIEIIKQRVMTRENLLRIIEKYSMYQEAPGAAGRVTPSEMIDEMRSRIGVTLINANVQNRGRNSAAIAFKVSFDHRRPEIAQRVANELVTLFLDENVKVRTERATQTTAFLTQEATKLKTELETLEGQIATYKLQHGAALPEHVALNANAILRLETDLRAFEAESRSAQDDLRSLEIELSAAKAGLGAPSPAGGSRSTEQELANARADLARVSNLYTESHPDVRAAKRKVDALDKAQASKGASGIETVADLQVARIENRIAATRARISQINAQQANLRGRIGQAEQQVLKAPQVERGLAMLMRDYENTQKKYTEIRAKQSTAEVAESLEDDQKAERFSLLEPPLFPDKPIKPDRAKMAALSFFLAIAASVGIVILLEMLHGTVRGSDAVAAIVGHAPLVSIPYIETAGEVARRQKLIKWSVAGGLAALIVVLLILHLLVMPLDLAFFKLLNRLG